ncbi:putative fatty acyl-CoA reductase CG5065 [Leptidea sinapis]|uniref:putative fatty acyl-CoA reductase CG5065 n=1 Tax=Leptidea sinapis TaxID=189913 RepID=UPI0021C464F8|nr:putative fatty acyl-CoA reductase CG5065 [Leptidea sinapis]
MAGDILEENFGLSDEHIKTLQRECQIVFHGAASVRFNMSLKDAVNLNIAGTYRALRLAEGMSKLEVFVHISTSYCRSDVQVLEEKLYACRHNAHHLMELVQWMEPELLDLLQKKITLPEPNTYGYTKCIAEGLVAEYNGRFPIVLARPSIVTRMYEERNRSLLEEDSSDTDYEDGNDNEVQDAVETQEKTYHTEQEDDEEDETEVSAEVEDR